MLSVFALAAFVLSANAQSASNVVTGNSDATLIQKLEISDQGASGFGGTNVANGALSFGSIGIGAQASAVKITTAAGGASRTSTSGDASIVQSSAFSAAAFKVVGEADKTYSISVPASGTVTRALGGTLNLDEFNFFTKKVGSASQGTLTGGEDFFIVGARLSIPSTALAGAYTGTFSVTVNYN